VEVVGELLNHGAKVDTSILHGRTFISLASEKGYLDLIRDVLDQVLSVNNIKKCHCASVITTAENGDM
jgi:hypothetical protein